MSSSLSVIEEEKSDSMDLEEYKKFKHRIQILQPELGRACTVCKKRLASFLIAYTHDEEFMKRSTCTLRSCAYVCLNLPFQSPSPILKPIHKEEENSVIKEEETFQVSGDIRAIAIPALEETEPYESHFNGVEDLNKAISLSGSWFERLPHPDPSLHIYVDIKAKENNHPVNWHIKKECGVNCVKGFKWPHGGVIITRFDPRKKIFVSLTEPLSTWGFFFDPFKSDCIECRLSLHNHRSPRFGKCIGVTIDAIERYSKKRQEQHDLLTDSLTQ